MPPVALPDLNIHCGLPAMVTYLLLQYTCMVLMSEAFYGTEIRGNLCLIKGSAFTPGCCLTNRIFLFFF